MNKDEQIKAMAPYFCYACEMNWGNAFGECIEGNDCTKCGIALIAAGKFYNAGGRLLAKGDLVVHASGKISIVR